jgi:hypothetical protein
MFFAARLDETVADLGKITPAWAARCIRKYQREGVVDWKGTRTP